MGLNSSDRVVLFDDYILSLYKFQILKRTSPETPFKLHHLKLLFISSFIILLQIVVTLSSSIHVEMSRLTEVCAISSAFFIAYSRLLFLIINSKKIDTLLEGVEDLFSLDQETQCNLKIQEYSKATLYKNKVIKFFCIFGSMEFLAIPVARSLFNFLILGRKYPYLYPFISRFPFDIDNWIAYFPIYIIQTYALLSAVMSLFIGDLIFSTSVTQLCIYYRYLGKRLGELDARMASKNTEQLSELVQYQFTLQKLVKQINEIFSLTTFFNFTMMKISLCMFMFSLVHGLDPANILPFITAISGLMFPVYIRCVFGTELHEASFNLVYSIYNQNWYEGTTRYRKMLALMMIRANKPVLLEASKVQHIQMSYFKEIIIQIYQIFMFLHNCSKAK